MGRHLHGSIRVYHIYANFRHDSPYYTSLSPLAWLIVTGMQFLFYQVNWWLRLSFLNRRPVFQSYWGRYRMFLLRSIQKAVEETALWSPSEIDVGAFIWTFESLDEDHELERFFSGLPGFRSSIVVNDPLPRLTEGQKLRLSQALIGLLNRTFSSDFLPVPVKKRRAMLCAKVTDPAHIPMAFDVLDKVISNYRNDGLLAAEMLQIVTGWGNDRDDDTGEDTTLVTQATVSSIIARVQWRDDPWFILASSELDIPESVLRNYAARVTASHSPS
ncbi:hypothetical protein EI94DRAFT_549186 [Lactarius quietus]|nr:hypothetical protein EI94DRAFT_549186 [Lactarius quietus]